MEETSLKYKYMGYALIEILCSPSEMEKDRAKEFGQNEKTTHIVHRTPP